MGLTTNAQLPWRLIADEAAPTFACRTLGFASRDRAHGAKVVEIPDICEENRTVGFDGRMSVAKTHSQKSDLCGGFLRQPELARFGPEADIGKRQGAGAPSRTQQGTEVRN